MKKPFRYSGNETPKEFHETPIDEILSAFYFPETAFEAETYGKCFFYIANGIYIADFQPSKREQYYMQSHKTNTISTKHEFNSWQRLYKVRL